MRALLRIIADVVVKNEEKMVIFASVPAQQALVFAITQALKIDATVYHSSMNVREKAALQERFNSTNSPMIRIGSYYTLSFGLNLQHSCHWVVFLGPPPAQRVGDQAGSRVHRIGQEFTCELVTLLTKDTFNDRQILNNIRKAVPSIISLLNSHMFKPSLAMDSDDAVELGLGDWVECVTACLSAQTTNAYRSIMDCQHLVA